MPIMKAWKWETLGSMINKLSKNYQKIWGQKDISQFKQNSNNIFCNNQEANHFAIQELCSKIHECDVPEGFEIDQQLHKKQNDESIGYSQ